MDLTRCSNGHFYDAERFSSCPYCSGAGQKDYTETVPYEENLTVTGGDSLEEKIKAVAPVHKDEDKTVSFYNKAIGSEPVVGWLVCIEGSHFGEDFRLTGGRNFIGRSEEMDVSLTNDTSISREKHAVLLYEPKANIFMLQPGDSKELSYLNDKVVLQAEVIQAYDIISLGETKLMFIPFCSDTFHWESAKKDEKDV